VNFIDNYHEQLSAIFMKWWFYPQWTPKQQLYSLLRRKYEKCFQTFSRYTWTHGSLEPSYHSCQLYIRA